MEREAYCCEILAERAEEGCLDQAPIWTDIKTFDGCPWRGVVDCVVGGYPCQPFSIAGQKKGETDERHLWPDVARIVREVEPRWAFFENVAHHLLLGFKQVSNELSELDYCVAAGVFGANEMGAPHKRQRLFILAHSGHDGKRNTGNRKIKRDIPTFITASRQIISDRTPADSSYRKHGNGSERNSKTEGWGKTEPDVGRMANGMAARMDRIRGCGNGVVPDVAAFAWHTLIRSLI